MAQNNPSNEQVAREFIRVVADDQYANWSDLLAMALKEMALKEQSFQEMASDLSDLFEAYRELGHMEGRLAAYDIVDESPELRSLDEMTVKEKLKNLDDLQQLNPMNIDTVE